MIYQKYNRDCSGTPASGSATVFLRWWLVSVAAMLVTTLFALQGCHSEEKELTRDRIYTTLTLILDGPGDSNSKYKVLYNYQKKYHFQRVIKTSKGLWIEWKNGESTGQIDCGSLWVPPEVDCTEDWPGYWVDSDGRNYGGRRGEKHFPFIKSE